MKSQYKYDNIIGDKEKLLISFYLNKGKTYQYISNRFGLSIRFIKSNLCKSNKINGIIFGSKKISYFKNEMNYGKLNIIYKWQDLNESEKLAYYRYKHKKHKAYYEL